MSRILFALAAAAAALVGCVREPEMLSVAGESSIHFLAESIETRTAFTDPEGTIYPVLWTANDKKVKLMLNMVSSSDADVTPAADFKTARFTASFRDTTVYTFFAISPASAWLSATEKVSDATVYRLGITVPTSQTPTAKSVDEAAQILVAQSKTYQFDDFAPVTETVTFNFKHWTAYGKLALTNLELGDAKIEAVDLTSEEPWAGRWNYFFSDGTSTANSASNTITVNTTSATDIWFACAPVDLSGKKLTVTVKTDKGTLTKEVTMPANRKFESGQVARFSVNMRGIILQEPEVYELVTKAEDLLYQSKVIIAAASEDMEYAVSTTQNTNNRAAAVVIKAEGKIMDPASNVEIFTVEAGTVSGTYAFKTSAGQYIYAAGTTKNNYLRSKADKDATGSWAITFGEKTVMKAQITDEGARNILQYNPNSGAPIFSCYASNSGTRDSVALYKLVGSGSEWPAQKKESGLWLEKTSVSVKVGESAEIAVDYDKMDEGYFTDGGSIQFVSDDETVATVDEDGMVLGVKAGTCTITVTAPETAQYNAASKACAITVTDPANAKTIAEVLALSEGKLNNAAGNGSIAEGLEVGPVTVAAFYSGNVVVKDATGLMLVYKSNHGLSVGDVVNLTGQLQNYYGVAEFVPSGTIEKVSSGGTVDHGTPAVFDEAAVSAYQTGVRTVKYVKMTASLPSSKSSAYMTLGSQQIRIYNTDVLADADLGKRADVYAYAYGYHSQGYLQVIVVRYEADASAPFLTVDATSKTWAADATDAFTVNVSIETGGTWTFTASGMDWATVAKSGNTLVVTPKAANTASTAKEGTVILTNSADATKTATVTFKQNAKPSGDGYSKFSGELVEGDYIIFYDGKAMNTTTANNRLQFKDVTPSGDMIALSDATGEIVWHLAKNGEYWTIYNAADAKYAVSTGTRNQATTSVTVDDKALWSVSGSETYEFVNKSNKAGSINANLRNNGTYGFACYSTSTGGALTLYKKN
ncbi:MAG: Ig-like domain-containing protein [Bacteroidales bacterium]|nr:Ig-like domain-containing protein [Bacteroidales bacterium]